MRAFPGLAEGDFAEATDFLQKMRDLGSLSHVHGEVTVAREAAVGWKSVEVAEQEFAGQCGRDRVLRLARECRADSLREFDLLLATLREQVSAPTEIFGGFAIVRNAGDGVARDGGANSQRDGLAGLLEKFVQQEGSAHAGMQQTNDLDSEAVAPADIDRQSSGSSLANDAVLGIAPLRVGDASLRRLQVRDFSRGKDAEHAAVLDPL